MVTFLLGEKYGAKYTRFISCMKPGDVYQSWGKVWCKIYTLHILHETWRCLPIHTDCFSWMESGWTKTPCRGRLLVRTVTQVGSISLSTDYSHNYRLRGHSPPNMDGENRCLLFFSICHIFLRPSRSKF